MRLGRARGSSPGLGWRRRRRRLGGPAPPLPPHKNDRRRGGGVPRLDPTGTPVGWDDVIPIARWAPLVAACQDTATSLVWEDAMTRAADTREDPEEIL